MIALWRRFMAWWNADDIREMLERNAAWHCGLDEDHRRRRSD